MGQVANDAHDPKIAHIQNAAASFREMPQVWEGNAQCNAVWPERRYRELHLQVSVLRQSVCGIR
jgi:hypothetical protein